MRPSASSCAATRTTSAGAASGERSPERIARRNGYRPRRWDTRAGTIEPQIPKLRQGSYFPPLARAQAVRRRALLAVVQQAYVEGVSARRVDDLVRSLRCEGISRSRVSRICSELDGVVTSFLDRPLDGGPVPLPVARNAHPARCARRAASPR